MKIDAEVHFWKYDKTLTSPLIGTNKILQQDYLPVQISQSLQRNGIDGCLAVSADKREVETRFLSELAVTNPAIRGVIGWVDLQSAKAAEKIRELHQYTAIKGWRMDSDITGPVSEEAMEMLRENGYTLDVCLSQRSDSTNLKSLLTAFPGQSFILSGGGDPDTKKLPAEAWKTAITSLAAFPNLSVKISTLFEHSNWKSWKPADFYPFLDLLFSSFGPDRVIYGSNWPFILLSGMYVQWKSLLEKFTEKFNPDDNDKFFGENAERIYGL